MSPVDALPTPAALIDLPRLERNCARMAQRARRLGVQLRPHVKTHKCVEAARIQVRGAARGVTVSTLAEARALIDGGFDDLTWAVPLAPARAAGALALETGDARLGLLVDDDVALDAVEAAARARGRPARVWLKLDCGYHRAGVDPDGDDGPRLARRMYDSPWIELGGVLTHAGHAYACVDRAAVAAVARQERDVPLAFAARLRDAGVDPGRISVGSTPTVVAADDLGGVDEVRPGNYALFDAFQAAMGSCTLDDVALSVLTTVVGRYPARDALVIDAGALALSKDPGPVHVAAECGFGVLTDLDGAILDRLRLTALSQEHGHVTVRGGLAPGALPVGTRLRVLPNHSCLTAALYDGYEVVEGGTVVGRWRPARGW